MCPSYPDSTWENGPDGEPLHHPTQHISYICDKGSKQLDGETTYWKNSTIMTLLKIQLRIFLMERKTRCRSRSRVISRTKRRSASFMAFGMLP
ncbi:hypothetical protein GcM3_126017 [Golovinomyces cichoracearum]|uniref:Uncharacterized protein n=1 Tax=Golovinomyces cichoracearum TaxID=62708 RepID=A0A420I613_9PEZI|nr:hypothetical protein GcM3_126017 [Golovinomyces cichoracearum]